MKTIAPFVLAASLVAANAASAAPIIRDGAPESPISSLVFVPAGAYDTAYVAGITPGDGPGKPFPIGTEAQTVSTLTKISDLLAKRGMTMGDVVMLRVFLAADPDKGAKADRAGMNAAFKRFFGTAEQPNKPSRTTIAVTDNAPGHFVEIDAIAVKAK